MKLKAWCDAVRGRATALAAHLSISQSAVAQMLSGEIPVPPGRYRQIADFTAAHRIDESDVVTLDDLVPPAPPSSHTPKPAVHKEAAAPQANEEPRRRASDTNDDPYKARNNAQADLLAHEVGLTDRKTDKPSKPAGGPVRSTDKRASERAS